MLYGFGAGGELIKDKASFNLNVFGNSSYDTPNLNVALPTGTISRALNLKSPRDNVFINGQLDYAVTLDQTIRFGYNAVYLSNENSGVGGYDEPERAFSTHNTSQAERVNTSARLGAARSRAHASSSRGPTAVPRPPPRRRPSVYSTRSPAAARSAPEAITRA
jgi:hypothetical protein